MSDDKPFGLWEITRSMGYRPDCTPIRITRQRRARSGRRRGRRPPNKPFWRRSMIGV